MRYIAALQRVALGRVQGSSLFHLLVRSSIELTDNYAKNRGQRGTYLPYV